MDYHHNADLAEMPRACFVKVSGKFYCEKPSRLRSARKVRHRPMREERHATGAIMGYYESNEDFVAVEADYDASSLFHSYESLIAQDLDIIGSEASIDLTVQPNTPLLSRLKASLDRRLGDVIGSELETSRFTPDEIYKMIGRYWDELIYSPWDSKTTNEYALLKNLCKRGSDDVNVWSEQIKGLFGFKVRTRDHSWIKGQIYCPSDCLSPTESTDIGKATCEGRADFTCKIGGSAYTSWKHHSMILGEVVSVGRCKFFISKERD